MNDYFYWNDKSYAIKMISKMCLRNSLVKRLEYPMPNNTKLGCSKILTIRVFPKCFHWICWIQWQNILVIYKRTWTYNFLCKGSECYQSATTTHATDRIFKLNPIHASVIYQIPWYLLNLLKSINSMKVLLHLGETPININQLNNPFWPKNTAVIQV